MSKFYIITHNPNTASYAIASLFQRANALEPDITHTNSNFYVFDSDIPGSTYVGKPTLAEYCIGLANQLLYYKSQNINLNLALIAWDMKSSSQFELALILKIIDDNFTSVLAAQNYGMIPMLFTTPDNLQFLIGAAQHLRYGLAFGTDDIGNPLEVDAALRNRGICYTYARGYRFWESELFGLELAEAIAMRNTGQSFKLVYTWNINNYIHMINLINSGVNGIITDFPGMLSNLIPNELKATKEDNPFTCIPAHVNYGPPDFKVKTYKFVAGEMFVAVNNSDGSSTLLKIKGTGDTMPQHNMFDITRFRQNDYLNNVNQTWLLGTQVFNNYIVDVIHAWGTTLIAFVDGKVLKVSGTGGLGVDMFNVEETNSDFHIPTYTTNPIFLLGDAKFNSRISCFKTFLSFTFIGQTDGTLLKVKLAGGTGHNMFNVTEQNYSFVTSDSNYTAYRIGDAKFNGVVQGMGFIKGYLFIWFNNGKLLKINGYGGSGNNMFAITESADGFNGLAGYNHYIGDQKFMGNVLSMTAITHMVWNLPWTLFIGFDNNKILKIHDTGGSCNINNNHHDMCGVTEPNAMSFAPASNNFSFYLGYEYLQTSWLNHTQVRRITCMGYISGYLVIGMSCVDTEKQRIQKWIIMDEKWIWETIYVDTPFGSYLRILGGGDPNSIPNVFHVAINNLDT